MFSFNFLLILCDGFLYKAHTVMPTYYSAMHSAYLHMFTGIQPSRSLR